MGVYSKTDIRSRPGEHLRVSRILVRLVENCGLRRAPVERVKREPKGRGYVILRPASRSERIENAILVTAGVLVSVGSYGLIGPVAVAALGG